MVARLVGPGLPILTNGAVDLRRRAGDVIGINVGLDQLLDGNVFLAEPDEVAVSEQPAELEPERSPAAVDPVL